MGFGFFAGFLLVWWFALASGLDNGFHFRVGAILLVTILVDNAVIITVVLHHPAQKIAMALKVLSRERKKEVRDKK